MQTLHLDELRSALIRQEETIIFALIERAQFKQNSIIYQPDGLPIGNSGISFSDYLLFETEKIHAKVRRYTSPDEYPFFQGLPAPIIPSLHYAGIVMDKTINVNPKIRDIYQKQLIPKICEAGDDQNYGSSATCDVTCLQALSKRIHYGKFVAEVKFQQDPEIFHQLIVSEDRPGLLRGVTDKDVEEKLLRRVEQKAAAYGRDIDAEDDIEGYKIAPRTVRFIYEHWIIPLTKEVEVKHLLKRSAD